MVILSLFNDLKNMYEKESLYLPQEKIIDRPVEDISRIDLKLRKMDGLFPDLLPEQENFLRNILRDTITNFLFDDLKHLRNFYYFQKKEIALSTRNYTSIFEEFQIKDDSDTPFKGGDCIDQNLWLKNKLNEKGISSYLVGFDAQGLINDAANKYVGLRHSGLVVPFSLYGHKSWYYLDPGIGITEPLLANDSSETALFSTLRSFRFLKKGNEIYALRVSSMEPEKIEKTLFEWDSDISFEWLNPRVTGTKDIMRCQRSFRTVKRGRDGDELAGIFLYPQTKNIMLKIRTDGEKEFLSEYNLDFSDFKDLKTSSVWEDFVNIANHIKRNPGDWFQELCEIIDFLPKYQSGITIPSAKGNDGII